jgi:hypothetical protein
MSGITADQRPDTEYGKPTVVCIRLSLRARRLSRITQATSTQIMAAYAAVITVVNMNDLQARIGRHTTQDSKGSVTMDQPAIRQR